MKVNICGVLFEVPENATSITVDRGGDVYANFVEVRPCYLTGIWIAKYSSAQPPLHFYGIGFIEELPKQFKWDEAIVTVKSFN